MSEQCFNSYVKTFENSLGNESELALKVGSISNLNDTIYGELQSFNFQELNQNSMFMFRTH